MKILVLGSDGYIGTALYWYLESKGHTVFGIDNGIRDQLVNRCGGGSVTPVSLCHDSDFDVCDYTRLKVRIALFKPDAVIHLAEIPSAPFSMNSQADSELTMRNNIISTLNILWAVYEVNPDIHIIKLATAGLYSDWIYDGMEIPEGSRVTVQYKGKDWTIPTPKYGCSYYHLSKNNDSNNIDYACKTWGLRCTDINQGPVYGHMYNTRFDCDEMFGTVLNRFIAQALVDQPLTVYGTGEQVRGYINLQNSLEAIELFINNPPKESEYRMVHQVTEEHSVMEIAKMVQAVTDCKIDCVDNPRVEMEKNNFKFERKALSDFGLKTIKMEDSIKPLIDTLFPYKKRIKIDSLSPKTKWRKS